MFSIQHPAWLCVGDFNETLYATEHFSLVARPEWQMRAFHEAADDCLFQDMGWSGTEYTWDNGQTGDDDVRARLDRAFGNPALIQMFGHSRVRHISTTDSDHCLVLVELRTDVAERRRGGKQFRYEDVW